MFRTWPWWITLFLLAISLGWFWLLSENLIFTRAEPEKEKTATAPAK
jgi:hypothetical protein